MISLLLIEKNKDAYRSASSFGLLQTVSSLGEGQGSPEYATSVPGQHILGPPALPGHASNRTAARLARRFLTLHVAIFPIQFISPGSDDNKPDNGKDILHG